MCADGSVPDRYHAAASAHGWLALVDAYARRGVGLPSGFDSQITLAAMSSASSYSRCAYVIRLVSGKSWPV